MDVVAQTWTKALDKGPVCAMWALLLVVASLFGSYWYAERTFASTADVEDSDRKIEALAETVQHGFDTLTARMDMSDADNRVRDLQGQVRQTEREIADLQMVVADMPDSPPRDLLESRAFALQQDLAELKTKLATEQANQQESRRRYDRARE